MPEISIETITPDDAFVVIGCDGIYDGTVHRAFALGMTCLAVLNDGEVVELAKKHYGNPKECSGSM